MFFDLTAPGLDRLVNADDIIRIPEFLFAYQRSNSGGVTAGIPKPKYADADKNHPSGPLQQAVAGVLRRAKKIHPEQSFHRQWHRTRTDGCESAGKVVETSS